MGRKSKSGKKSAKDESDEGEVQEDLESEVAVDRSDAFDMSEAIEMLSEKKYNLREPALKKIISFMQGSHDGEESLQVLDGFTETLTTHLTRMLRRPASDQEGILCLQLVCLLALYLSGDAVSLLKSIEKPIMALIQAKEATPLQSQALFTWSFTSFVSEKEEIVHEALETIESILLNECGDEFGDELLTRAAEGWVLLCTLLPAATVLSKSKDESLFEALFTQIDEASSTSINSKVAAGKAIAFIYECAEKLNPDAQIDDLGTMVCDDARAVQQGLESLRKIARDSSKKVSKKNRKEQRAEFRDIVEFLESGEVRSEMLRMQGADVVIEGFGQSCVVDFLREVLESGFQSALINFPAVQALLEVDFMTSESVVSKGVKTSKSSAKQRTLDRQRDRGYCDIYSMDFQGDESS